ncbi:Pentatricopeptide repeat - like 10 [Theobroma cacao]|nr:Pentatricopeptide repeat - like 10 [Theobroma cacao]
MAGTSLSPLTTSPTFKTLTTQTQPKTKTKDSSSTGSLYSCNHLTELKKLHCQITKQGLIHHPSSITKLISTCTQMGTFDSVIYARKILNQFTQDNQNDACAQLGSILWGKCCHGYVLRKGLEGWDSYIRNGDIGSAWEVFNNMPESDLVSWNTIISALVQESMFKEAIELFRMMQSEGIKADRVTMVSIASACGYLGALDLAKWIHAYIKKNKVPCDIRLSTALVDMFARCGDPLSAMEIFNKMEKRDVSAWTAAIGAMAMEGNGNQAIELFNEMLREGVKPDGVVFVGLLTACSHGGLVEQGQDLFRSMKSVHGISPQIVHYGCIVDLIGRAGLLEQALDLIKGMPMEPNDVIWGSLLAACRMHRNVDMAAYAAERIKELASERTGIQVLLSNIYASAGKWTDVAKVRLHLKEKGARKVPGSSSIEINGEIHEFTSGDESHPEMIHIAPMLDEMNRRVRDAGHAPDLSNVLLNVDEQEKEYLLSRHSEKLAMAFGLISTNQGMPIRVVKNLRICSDCHSFAKLASKIYDREIIVRDNNRFHFFQRGICSCNDYW